VPGDEGRHRVKAREPPERGTSEGNLYGVQYRLEG
jgi:hypothetical protein